jgi:hypothetical protein
MKGILVGIFRIQAIDGKAAAEPVATVVHIGAGPDNTLAGEAPASSIHCPEYGAGFDYLAIIIRVI